MGTLFETGRAGEVHRPPALELRDLAQRQGAAATASSSASRRSPGYSYNERSFLSLAVVDVDVDARDRGDLVWGEEGGGTAKPVVERHAQTEIRAVVSPCPYSEVARTQYAEGWRTRAGV